MTISKQLELAFSMAREEHAGAFERFANGFLVDDYPELQPLGGKHDRGMDARIVRDADGHTTLVVQSCISPEKAARSKILGTIEKLSKDLPETVVYCTSAKIGTKLDATKRELRKDRKISLEICDAEWFCQRIETSANRAALSKSFFTEILNPLLKEFRDTNLYSAVLSDNEARLAIQYLEAHQLDGSTHRNFTKSVFDALIVFATRETAFPDKLVTTKLIVETITKMFPESHASRIQEIVPGRIEHLVGTDVLKRRAKDNAVSLAYSQKTKFEEARNTAAKREVAFRALLWASLQEVVEHQQIDYVVDFDEVIRVAHECVLWFLHEQGTQLRDGTGNLINVLNAEEVVDIFRNSSSFEKIASKVTEDALEDILPSIVFRAINSEDPDTKAYLRGKADLFIVEAFLQASPDVQKACKKLFADDILFADTSILIRCLAEKYSLRGDGPLLRTFQSARQLGIKLRTWRPWVEEFASHLKGPVKLEWMNCA